MIILTMVVMQFAMCWHGRNASTADVIPTRIHSGSVSQLTSSGQAS